MKSPSDMVVEYIREMYEWETDAASDLTFQAMDMGCFLDMDLTVLASKLSPTSEPDPSVHDEYFRIVRKHLTQRHRTRHMEGFGSPPRHDPDIEEIVGDPIILDDEAHINTRLNDFSDSPAERFYRLVFTEGTWRIDQITEKTLRRVSRPNWLTTSLNN